MMSFRHSVRQMAHLAARFTGRNDVHVVDPMVDLRYIWEATDALKLSLEERRSKIDSAEVKQQYDLWWNKYEQWKAAEKDNAGPLKKELRDLHSGLLNALALPNFVREVGNKEKEMLKNSKHVSYLCKRGLMRVDKENETVSLVGYPVSLQQFIKNQLLDLFIDANLISPSYFARVAVLEGVNVNPAAFIRFTDNSESFPETYLVGHSLMALLTSFIRCQFTEKNKFPITVQSSGMGYHEKRNTVDLCYARQRLKHCVLSMNKETAQVDEFAMSSLTNIAGLLQEGFLLEDAKARVVRGKELRNYESKAIVLEDKGLELVRVSCIDDYISKRLNVRTEYGGFIQMTYVETDIDRVLSRIIDNLIDGKELPRSLRSIIKV